MTLVSGAQVLTSEPSGPFCQGPVTFTCRGTDSPFIFNWVLNGSVITTYLFSRSDTYPLLLNPMAGSSFPPGVTIEVDNAALGSQISINITSTLMVSNVSTLNGSSLSCGDPGGGSSNVLNVMANSTGNLMFMYLPVQHKLMLFSFHKGVTIHILGPPSSATFVCSIQHAPSGLQMNLQWIPFFNVQGYNVTVTPDPSSCSSDQVPSNEDYICSGLDPETDYSITVTAISSCGEQEGWRQMFRVSLQRTYVKDSDMIVCACTTHAQV